MSNNTAKQTNSSPPLSLEEIQDVDIAMKSSDWKTFDTAEDAIKYLQKDD